MIDERLLARCTGRFGGVKVVYTDLDGTMLGRNGSFMHDADGTPTLEPARALVRAHERGIDVVPASGRNYWSLQRDARMFGMGTVIADMGAMTGYDFGAEVVTNFGMLPDGADLPVPAMEQTGAIDLILDRFDGRLEYHAPWHVRRECTQLFRGLVDPVEVERMLEQAGHGWLTLHDNGRLHGQYLDLPKGQARVYHLLPKGVSKGIAVARDRERRGFAKEECVAIGDSLADLELAPEVGTFVMVGDAVAHDPAMAEQVLARDNVVVTERHQNLGWVDTLLAICEA